MEAMMKKMIVLSPSMALILVFIFGYSPIVRAHFGMVIPSDSMVMQGDNRTITLTLSFSHPFERIGMELVKPKEFSMTSNGRKTDLTGLLKKTSVMDSPAWTMDFPVKRPGGYTFFMEPEPYWEPSEDCFIIHRTKTIVAAFGEDEGWDTELGVETEIVPLSKPFGLYSQNVFQGVVKQDGNPVPYAEVEVAYYNRDGKYKAPTDYMITQTIKADPNGVFTYAVPKSGWWGFAALNIAEYKLKHDGVPKEVEIGAVIWVKFQDWQTQ
jgi:cobalt/nickel transport protein